MPLPLAPVAVVALKVGAVALTTWAARNALRRASTPGRRDQRLEDAFDALPEGLTLQRAPITIDSETDGNGLRGSGRLSRRFSLGQRVWHLDAAVLTRLQLKKCAR